MKWTGISSFTTRQGSSPRGFTLTELAIVMGVGALIIGSVWAAGSQIWEKSRQESLRLNINTIVKNMRSYYAAQRGITGNYIITQTLASAGVTPGDITRTGGTCARTACVDHPWGPQTRNAALNGSILLCAWNIGTTTSCTAGTALTVQHFAVELFGIPAKSCIDAAMLNSGPDASPGLYDVTINGQSILANGFTLPVPASVANTECNKANPAVVDFVYRISAPQS